MVMPFDVKATGRTEDGVPVEVDFDALWDRVYEPVLDDVGYDAVRADHDVSALIITEMIQRLAIADLVVADISLPNANVYYEVGVRHAAKAHGCVLVAADWARPVFDLGQIRQLRFPLADGAVEEATAAAARKRLRPALEGLAAGTSPVFDAVPGYPGEPQLDRVAAFKGAVAELSEFNVDVRAVREAPRADRPRRVRELLERHGGSRVVREAVVLELMRLVRDNLGWEAVIDYIATLPTAVREHPLVKEQHALALGKTGDPAGAVGQLQELIAQAGETAERLGLLGGRYKDLRAAATEPGEKRRYLRRAIESYERGMTLDLGNYYPSSNLARLYRERGEPGDEQRAAEAEVATALACRAAIARGTADEWVRPTLLGNAFDRGDVAEAIRLRGLIEEDGPDAWKLATTLADLRRSTAQHDDDTVRAGLAAVLDELEALAPASAL